MIGSFCTVVYSRLLQGQSIVFPRSHCPQCRHTLGPADLIPVLSYVLSRGRCRHCHAPIPVRYPLTELAAGTGALLAGYLGGWGAGLGLLVLAGPATAILAHYIRTRSLRQQAGFMLIEVLAAVTILAISLAPAMDTISMARRSGVAAQQRSLVVGLARTRLNQLTSIAASQGIAAIDSAASQLDGATVSGVPALQPYTVSTVVEAYDLPSLRRVKVTVSCASCPGSYGLPARPVTLSMLIRG